MQIHIAALLGLILPVMTAKLEPPETGLETLSLSVDEEIASLAKRSTSSDDLAPWHILSCTAKAAVTCDRAIWPPGSYPGRCVDIKNIRIWAPGHQALVKCYCESKDLQKRWWDCFYEGSAKCPNQIENMDKVHYQEWVFHRQSRRLHCLDDFKPNPPWDKINDYMRTQYNTSAVYQYSRDW